MWSDVDVLNAAIRNDLGTFVGKVFQTVSPQDRYFHSWHTDAIAYALARINAGDDHRLIVTQPPRSLKSICVSVAYVAWALGHKPNKGFICVSHTQELAFTFARQFRLVVNSDWYRSLFPGVRPAKDTENEFVTTQGGGRLAVAVGGSLTGRGADVIILDDPIKAADAQSETTRRAVNEWFGNTLVSRLNDKANGAIILVMQRLHEDDLAGKLLSEHGWVHLNLPAIAEEDEKIPIGPDAIHVRRQGEALQPERESIATLDVIKHEMGSLAFSAQYQQRPVPITGNLIKREWLKTYDEVPAFGETVQSWDIASTTANLSDFSVCTTWRKHRRNYYLLDVWRGRLEFPHLRRHLVVLARQHKPSRILIENAGPGLHLIQELRETPIPGVPIPIGIQPNGEKLVRMEAQSARFESGQVFLPRQAPWLADLMNELLAFPNSRHDDQIDSVSQFLNWAESSVSRSPVVSICGPIVIR